LKSKKFSDVFSKIKFSSNVVNILKNAVIDNIKVYKKENKMDIFMHHDKIIDEVCIPEFKKDIINNFPFITKVNVNLLYNIEEYDVNTKIEKYWNNILNLTNKYSPVCFTILKESKWYINNSSLIIDAAYNGSFLLKYKKIDIKIKQQLKRRFNIDLNVNFKDAAISQKQKDEINNDFKNEISNLMLNSENLVADSIEQQKSISKKILNQQKNRKIKINTINESAVKMSNVIKDGEEIVVSGKILTVDLKEIKSERYLLSIDMTDLSDSVTVKFFIDTEDYKKDFKNIICIDKYIKVKGKVQFDTFSNELNIIAYEINESEPPKLKEDTETIKRVELHLHTQMSMMDGITSATKYIERAAKWGHKYIAITDHGVVQAFPEAMNAAKKYGVKVIYGVEAYLVDDLGTVVQSSRNQSLDDEYVVFDIETTGLKKETDKIIEIGAVKINNNKIVDNFSVFVNPKVPLSDKIIKLTSITDEMLKDALTEDEVIPKFLNFAGNAVLVAHNANFDVGFIRQWAKNKNIQVNNTVVDTVGLSKVLFPELKKYKLDIVCEHLGISLENHHRAVDDAHATAEIFIKCMSLLKEKSINNINSINSLESDTVNKKQLKTYHAVILVKNQKGLRNLYELISLSHIKYYHRRPRIPKSEYLKYKDGLIIGTACEAGEFYRAVFENKPDDIIKQLIDFYDYIEVQPIGNNEFMIEDGTVASRNELIEINKRIIKYGEIYNKTVVATCDCHFLDPEDEYYRRIIQAGEGFKNADNQPPLYYRTTDEMLKEFDYIDNEKAREIVIKNTNLIAEMIEDVKPIPDETFPPKIDGAEEKLIDITTTKAHSIYGNPLPKLVQDRLNKELNSIIKNGFAVLYIIAQKLVWDSNEHGYVVGSRGSVGSSFVATMAGITEVNPLPPHYICKKCKYSDFKSDIVIENAGNSGCDLPDKICPVCGEKLSKDGHDIPFETFLGFDGDKEPDIDLNFSGEYQQQAHQYTEQLFGEGHVFKAGTIGTMAEKTAYGYVKKYVEERDLKLRTAEMNRLKLGCVGIKRTTGQHPGGLMVVPRDNNINEFTPIQRPANDTDSNITTTHFDYHSISGRLLKLDLLGHDVPTILRMFKDITGFDPLDVPLDDRATISLFTSPKALNVTEEEINCSTGSLGLPEFGTPFVRQMLMDTKPTTFSELVRISGLSHGTDVWFNNAQELIKNNVATLRQVIPTRDDIMVYLIIKGVEKKTAFSIMEAVRKGKGLTDEFEKVMKDAHIENWYIQSCKKIKYMFPKGHAVAYVTNTFRIGYFKIYYPYAFYAAIFSVKTEDFDYILMCNGDGKVTEKIKEISSQGKLASTKDKNILTILELVHEMYARKLKFVPMDLYKSDSRKFKVTEDGLLPPLCTIQGLGENAADSIVSAREEGGFFTIDEFRTRTKVSKTVISLLKKAKIFNNMPETDQLTLF